MAAGLKPPPTVYWLLLEMLFPILILFPDRLLWAEPSKPDNYLLLFTVPIVPITIFEPETILGAEFEIVGSVGPIVNVGLVILVIVGAVVVILVGGRST